MLKLPQAAGSGQEAADLNFWPRGHAWPARAAQRGRCEQGGQLAVAAVAAVWRVLVQRCTVIVASTIAASVATAVARPATQMVARVVTAVVAVVAARVAARVAREVTPVQFPPPALPLCAEGVVGLSLDH